MTHCGDSAIVSKTCRGSGSTSFWTSTLSHCLMREHARAVEAGMKRARPLSKETKELLTHIAEGNR